METHLPMEIMMVQGQGLIFSETQDVSRSAINHVALSDRFQGIRNINGQTTAQIRIGVCDHVSDAEISWSVKLVPGIDAYKELFA